MRNNNISNDKIAEKMFENNIPSYWINKFFISEMNENKNNNEIINIEWGGYSKLLPRMSIDIEMDKTTPNPGVQFAEKMISGYYLGELVRLLSIEVFRENITNYAQNTSLNFKWKFKSEIVSEILINYYDNNIQGILDILQSNKCGLINFNLNDAKIFGKICRLIINRSADIASALLLGALEKTRLFNCYRDDPRNPFEQDRFELTNEYIQNNNKYVTVGIDGSVFQYVPKYKQRMEETILKIVGKQVAQRIKLVQTTDGSGKGAALAVACLYKNYEKEYN
eukprot:425404_1